MVLETHKIGCLYFVKNPYRRDLDQFCTTTQELQKIYNKATLSYSPIIYEVQFWLSIPKFKKLSAANVKKLFVLNLSENPFKSLKTTAQKPNAKQRKKTLSANYKRPNYNLETSGKYEFSTSRGNFIIESYGFERATEKEDSLQIQNELRPILGSILIKNSAWNNLSKGKTVQAQSSKGLKGKLKKLK